MLSRKNIKKTTPRHIISKLQNTKEKEKIIKSSQKKQYSTCRGTVIELTNGLSLEKMRKNEPEDIRMTISKGWKKIRDFPRGAVVSNLPAIAGDTGLIFGLGRSHMPRSN